MELIFDRHSRMVFCIALKILKRVEEAEDVMQEVLLQLWSDPARYDPERGALGAWLAIISKNCAIDVFRKRRPTISMQDHVVKSSANVASAIQRRIDASRLIDGFKQLPFKQRQLMTLAYIDGLSHPEIAAASGLPLGTVKTCIRTGLGNLRKMMSVTA